MKVTFLLPTPPFEPVGGYRVVYEYASGLARRGHAVEVVHAERLRQHPPRAPRKATDSLRMARDRVRATATRLLGPQPQVRWHDVDPDVRLRVVPTLTSRHVPRADAVVATAWETAEYASGLPSDRGVGFYLIQHHETWSGPKEQVDATWRLPLFKVVIARWLLEKAQSMGLDDVIHIPNAIDLGVFRVTTPLDQRPPRVAMLYSTWHSWKGTDVGLEALRLAKREVPELQAVLFGVSEPPPGTPDWITTRRQPTQRELVEHVYNSSRLYLCPSSAEGWHLPPAEAMACGCALVSTDIGGVRDYAVHGTNALLCPVGDAPALAAAVMRLLRDDRQRLALAAAAARTMTAFSWDRSVSDFEDYLSGKLASERS